MDIITFGVASLVWFLLIVLGITLKGWIWSLLSMIEMIMIIGTIVADNGVTELGLGNLGNLSTWLILPTFLLTVSALLSMAYYKKANPKRKGK